jgi:hypothetical protein
VLRRRRHDAAVLRADDAGSVAVRLRARHVHEIRTREGARVREPGETDEAVPAAGRVHRRCRLRHADLVVLAAARDLGDQVVVRGVSHRVTRSMRRRCGQQAAPLRRSRRTA